MSQYVDATAGAVEHCEAMSKEFPDLAEAFYTPMADACRQKLWHQLTLLVLEFVSSASSKKTARTLPEGTHTFLALYDKVITRVDSKLHPLLLAKIASQVANALSSSDITAAKAVLENLISKKDAIGIPATIFAESKLALLLLLHTNTNTTTTSSGDATMADDEASGASASSSSDEKTILASVLQVLQANAAKLDDMRMLTTRPRPTNTETASAASAGAGGGTASSSADLATVFAAHYEASLTYYKRVGPPEAFYEQAMQFLNYAPPPPLPSSSSSSGTGGGEGAAASPVSAAAPTAPSRTPVDVTMISTTDYHQLAVDLCLAALTGDGVYNLGQVVEEQTVLLQYLKQQPSQFYWLVELLQSVADGNVLLFEELTRHRYAAEIAHQPALVHRAAAVREKLTLLCLVWLVFQKASHERTLTFEELAQALHLQDQTAGDGGLQASASAKDQVEWVIMRALSVHLMEGFIDQVDQTVTVTWILPRVLNAEQMQSLANSFAEWAVKVRSTTDSITAHQHPSSSSAAATAAATGVAAAN